MGRFFWDKNRPNYILHRGGEITDMKIKVFHTTCKKNLADILKRGIKTSYRNKKLGYTQDDSVVDLDIELDNIAKKYFKNKPKRQHSNFAWLNFEKAKSLKPDHIILEIEVDINTVYISNQGLWDLCSKHVDTKDETNFILFAQVYWRNVIPYMEYSKSDKLKLIEGINPEYIKKIETFYKFTLPEAIIPFDILPSMIKLCPGQSVAPSEVV